MENVKELKNLESPKTESQTRSVRELQRREEEIERLKRELEEVEKKYKNVFENATWGIFQTTPDGRILDANPSFAKIHGYSSPREMMEEIKDIASQLYVNPKDREILIEKVEKEGMVSNFEVQMYRKDKSVQWISINMRAVKDEEGRTLYYEGTMQDVTDRKLAALALKESEERYRVAIENSNDGIAIIGGDMHLYVNKRFVEMFEYESPQDIIGKPITFVVHPDDQELVRRISTMRRRGEPVPKRYEFKGITRTGKIIYVEVSAASISFKGQPAYLVFLRDITERKEAEKLLMEEKERLNTLLENAPIGIALISEKGVFKYVNPKFREIFGYDRRDVPDGKTFLRRLFPDHNYRRKVIAEWVENVRNIQVGQKFPRIFTISAKNGEKKIINFIPVRLATGEHIIAFEDITERIEAEEALKKSKDELERLNVIKSKAIDHISHEIKTPVSVFLGNLRILKRKLTNMNMLSHFEKMIEAMERNANRLLEISRETDEIFKSQIEFERVSLTMEMDDLLTRLERVIEVPREIKSKWEALKAWIMGTLAIKEETEEVEILSLVEKVIENTKRKMIGREIDLKLNNPINCVLRINSKVLFSTLNGLIKNAVENTPDGGEVTIEMEKLEERLIIRVNDTGIGISEENLSHIFDGLFHAEATELYRSRKPYDFGAGGKGLELFMIRRYALKYGFEISVDSVRCKFIPSEKDSCPGNTKVCKYISDPQECKSTGGTVFTLSFPLPNP